MNDFRIQQEFVADIMNIAYDRNQAKGYYNRLKDYIASENFLDEEDCDELVNRITLFIWKEIWSIREEYEYK